MTKGREPPRVIPSAQEWGQRVAAEAPPWSDKGWRRACAILRITIVAPALNDLEEEEEGELA